ncbi:hypothetical protein RHGRI_024484 [Rhododendron griersonianum]|uniref:Uncharacterized protein n=1 Tax=Rhododendron griersonianum TaxID=479676 RepID=A0AAV6JES0_9ERIC|nr:hypothetical protein RHGRI_024484 [Rhododendron griersonianum]
METLGLSLYRPISFKSLLSAPTTSSLTLFHPPAVHFRLIRCSGTLSSSVDHWREFSEAAKHGNLIPLYRSIPSGHLTPETAYRCLVKEDERDAPSFLFESVEPGCQQFIRSQEKKNPALLPQNRVVLSRPLERVHRSCEAWESDSSVLEYPVRSPDAGDGLPLLGEVDHWSEFSEAAKHGNLIPLYWSITSDHLTPETAYRCLVKEDERDAPSFLFESDLHAAPDDERVPKHLSGRKRTAGGWKRVRDKVVGAESRGLKEIGLYKDRPNVSIPEGREI